LALQGRFVTLEERLYARRVHAKSACFMSRAERYAYEDTSNSPYRHAFPRLRAYLGAPLSSGTISGRQRLRCLAQVARATLLSRAAKLKHRLPAFGAPPPARKSVYQ
jgi:hypothetical protein